MDSLGLFYKSMPSIGPTVIQQNQNIMEASTSMYYTFSTIAQVLGAFIGLSAVYVIFRIQEMKEIILTQYFKLCEDIKTKKHLQELFPGEIDFFKHHRTQDLKKIYEVSSKIFLASDQNILNKVKIATDAAEINELAQKLVTDSDLEKAIRDTYLRRKTIINLTRWSIGFGLPTVIFSIFFLASVHKIETARWVFYMISLIGTCISMTIMGIVIFIIIGEIDTERKKYKKANHLMKKRLGLIKSKSAQKKELKKMREGLYAHLDKQ